MKFGILYNTGYYGTDPVQMTAVAQHAERCGFESFYVAEHIALYPGATVGGGVEIPPSTPIADPLECLSLVAAGTRRILLGTGVLPCRITILSCSPSGWRPSTCCPAVACA